MAQAENLLRAISLAQRNFASELQKPIRSKSDAEVSKKPALLVRVGQESKALLPAQTGKSLSP